jgi:transposase-like protein
VSASVVTSGVRQVDLSRAWGVSRQTVSRYVKEGMPLENLEAAEAWRLSHKGVGKMDGCKPSNNNNSAEKGSVPRLGNGELAGLLERVSQTEEKVWQQLQENLNGGTSEQRTQLLRQHKEAAAIRLKVATEAMELDQKSGRLVEIADAKAHVRALMAPLAVGLRALAGRVSIKANPGRPEMAEKAIEEEIQRLLGNFNAGIK